MKKIIYIVGIGGRTGAMFCRELQGACDIVGIGMAREAQMIAAGDLKLSRGGAGPEALKAEVVQPDEFAKSIEKKYPDFIWLAVRNPVAAAVKFYYSQFKGKEKIPALIISQNGLSAIGDAHTALEEVLGQDADKVIIIRVSLINGIDLIIEGGTSVIQYKIPIKLGFGAVSGQSADLREILLTGKIKIQEFQGADVFKMENSKLFTNLIGMAAAVNGLTVSVGFRDKNIFAQEVAMLKEYVVATKKSGGGFLDDYAGYSIKFLAGLMLLPVGLLMPFRTIFGCVVAKGRNRPKDLSEIDYYNGEVLKLGKQYNVPTPVNETIVAKAKEISAKSNN